MLINIPARANFRGVPARKRKARFADDLAFVRRFPRRKPRLSHFVIKLSVQYLLRPDPVVNTRFDMFDKLPVNQGIDILFLACGGKAYRQRSLIRFFLRFFFRFAAGRKRKRQTTGEKQAEDPFFRFFHIRLLIFVGRKSPESSLWAAWGACLRRAGRLLPAERR